MAKTTGKAKTQSKAAPEKSPKRRGPAPMYSDPAILQAKIDEYLATTGYQIATLPDGSIAKDGKGNAVWRCVTPTMAGLAYHLGFSHRQSLQDMVDRAREHDATQAQREISCIISRARLRIEAYWEGELTTPGCANGVKLWLTNHGGYHDKQEIEHQGGIAVADISGLSPGERDALLKAVEKV